VLLFRELPQRTLHDCGLYPLGRGRRPCRSGTRRSAFDHSSFAGFHLYGLESVVLPSRRSFTG
ncbi:MAG: hypothetical protein KDM81_22340, partial [Verrucomicrobiae bacterium]|nr:hypothetical protein [Verrucomicrobiae bacterium]